MTILYGIPNCDSIKKTQKWLTENNIPYTFHDFRKNGIDQDLLASFLEHLSWTELLNKRSTSFRALSTLEKENLSELTIIPLLIASPTLIKRPLLVHNGQYVLGYNIETYHSLFIA